MGKAKGGGPHKLRERFLAAQAYALELHRTQVRKGTPIPYISHPLAVCSLVLEDGGSEDEAIAALLHDGPEDQGGQAILDEIRRRFGDSVADIVFALSDALPALGEEKPPWRERKEQYLARLENEPPEVLRGSLADKLHNARAIAADLADPKVGERVWLRFNADRDDQAWYYRSLLSLFYAKLNRSHNLPAFIEVVLGLFPVPVVKRLPAGFKQGIRKGLSAIQSRNSWQETHRVYVALLADVRNDPTPYSLYVGSTGKPVEVRYVDHLVGRNVRKRWIECYGRGLILQSIESLNPMTRNNARAVEGELIEALRAEGFSVHGSA